MTARRRPLRIAAACAVLATVTGLSSGCALLGDDEKTSKSAYAVDGSATELVSVDTGGGDIEVVAGDRRSDAIRVTERFTYDKQKPNTEHTEKGGRLALTADDCGDPDRTCDVDYEVKVPAGTTLRLKSGGGDVKVTGVSGTVRADTEGGDVHVDESSSASVTAHTDGGDILGAFTKSPSAVAFTSAGGDIDVRLPDTSYAVDATTSGGTREVTVPVKAGSTHHVKAHTDGGDVSVSSTSS